MHARIRPPAVAGQFYPRDSAQLARDVRTFLRSAAVDTSPRPEAIVVPHAGYVYSGATAATAYVRLIPWRATIRRIVLLGPCHRVPLAGMALPSVDAFATPLGPIAIDLEGVDSVAGMPGVVIDDIPHAQEHSLEVQLPFLQSVLTTFKLVPLVVGHADASQVAAAVDKLRVDNGTLIVVSTDLSHFLSYEDSRLADSATCETIMRRSPTINTTQACGAFPLNGFLQFARQRGWQPEMLHLCNSGDTAGDRRRVVGYAAFAFHSNGEAHDHR